MIRRLELGGFLLRGAAALLRLTNVRFGVLCIGSLSECRMPLLYGLVVQVWTRVLLSCFCLDLEHG